MILACFIEKLVRIALIHYNLIVTDKKNLQFLAKTMLCHFIYSTLKHFHY